MIDYTAILKTKISERNTLNKEIELLEQLQELKQNNEDNVEEPNSYKKVYDKNKLDTMSSTDIQNIICNNIVRIVYIKKNKKTLNEKRIFKVASYSADFVYKKWGNNEYLPHFYTNKISILEEVDNELHYKNLIANNIFKMEVIEAL